MERPSKGGWRDKGQSRRRRPQTEPEEKPAARPTRSKPPHGKTSRRRQREEELTEWKRGRPKQAQSAGSKRALGFLALAVILLLLAVAYVIYILPRGSRTPFVILTVTKYAAPIPPNDYAFEDAKRLAGINRKNLNPIRDDFRGLVSKSTLLDFVREQLTRRPGGPNSDVTILYLSAHGVVDGENRPCLLCTDSGAWDTSNWLTIEELLRAIKQQQEGREDGRKIVLLVDAGRIESDWSLGILYNGFAQRLADVAATVDVPRLFIINAASSGQIAWPSPERDGTFFGFYVAKALAGEASSDTRVSLLELYRYVEAQTARWVANDRDATQHPQLIPPVSAEQDFDIAFAGRGAVAEPDESRLEELKQSIAGMLQKLHPLWARHDAAIAKRDALRIDPLGLASVQRKLLRLEQLALAGEAYQAEFTETVGGVATQLQQLGDVPIPDGVHAFSLPLALQLEQGDAAPGTGWQAMLEQWRAVGGLPTPPPGEPPPPPPGELAASQVAWTWLCESPPADRSTLQKVIDFVSSSERRQGLLYRHGLRAKEAALPRPVEIEYLRMLASSLDWQGLSQEPSGRWRSVLAGSLRARRFCELAAAPEDERVHYFVQPVVNTVDQRRRQVEDWLFVGSPSAVQQADQDLQTLIGEDGESGLVSQAIRLGRDVGLYYAARDEVWSQLPYLTHWLVGQLKIGTTDEIGQDLSQLVNDAFLLIQRNHDLSAQLDLALARPLEELPQPLVAAYADVQRLHGNIRNAYWEYCKYLDGPAGNDKPALRKIGMVLRTPLPDTEQRQDLMAKYLDLLFLRGGLATAEAGGTAPLRSPAVNSADEAASPNDADLNYRKTMADWELHPALRILDRAKLDLLIDERKPKPAARTTGETELAWLARQGEEVRKLLSGLSGAADALESVTDSHLQRADETAANTRAGLSEADRLARAAATFLFERSWADPAKDPAHRLRVIDGYFHLLWNCWRVLGDFWGTPTGPDGEPYFVAVADQYIQSAQTLLEKPRTPRYNNRDLEQLIDLRRQAARNVQIAPETVLTLRDEPFEPHSIDIRWTADIPEGRAAVFVEEGGQDRGGQAKGLVPVLEEAGVKTVRRHALQLGHVDPHAVVKQQLAIDQSESVDDLVSLQAKLFYRGHVYTAEFQVRGPRYVSYVEVKPQKLPSAKVTVQGNAKRRGFIMFIYDCSGSMNSKQRFITAERAFQSVLQTLLAEGNYEVGLRAYGRRSKFPDGNNLALRQYADNEAGKEAERQKLHPDLDVERLLPIDALDKEHFARFEQQLPRLRPMGQTPLYLAIQRCYLEHDFLHAGPDDAKRIIVITDGVNFQADPNLPNRTEKTDVEKIREEMPQYRDVRIDIIALDPGDLKPEERKRLQEFRSLSEETHGAYYEVNSVMAAAKSGGGGVRRVDQAASIRSFVDTLRKALQLVSFNVSPFGGAPTEKTADLGQTWHVTNLDPSRPEYTVRIVGIDDPPQAAIALEGGESALLAYDDALQRLTFPPYDTSDRQRGQRIQAVDPKTQRRYYVQAMLARRYGKDVDFQVYVQDLDERSFTYRPKHVWAEISTQGDGPQMTYYFSDPEFVPDEPVPVFRFRAKDWPETVGFATIRLWFHFRADGVQPDKVLDVDPLRPAAFEIPSLPGIKFAVKAESLAGGGYRIHVSERHDTVGDSDRVRVKIYPDPRDGLGHRYYAGVEVVKHEFDFQQPKPTAIEITGSKRIKADAIEATLQDIPVE